MGPPLGGEGRVAGLLPAPALRPLAAGRPDTQQQQPEEQSGAGERHVRCLQPKINRNRKLSPLQRQLAERSELAVSALVDDAMEDGSRQQRMARLCHHCGAHGRGARDKFLNLNFTFLYARLLRILRS